LGGKRSHWVTNMRKKRNRFGREREVFCLEGGLTGETQKEKKNNKRDGDS